MYVVYICALTYFCGYIYLYVVSVCLYVVYVHMFFFRALETLSRGALLFLCSLCDFFDEKTVFAFFAVRFALSCLLCVPFAVRLPKRFQGSFNTVLSGI